jgi:hypothetical protein
MSIPFISNGAVYYEKDQEKEMPVLRLSISARSPDQAPSIQLQRTSMPEKEQKRFSYTLVVPASALLQRPLQKQH